MSTAAISPMLAVGDPAAAIAFYKQAFGATEVWVIGDPPQVARLDILGAPFFLAQDQSSSPRSPDSVGHTTVRIELFVDDPRTVLARAAAVAGRATNREIEPHEHELATPQGQTLRMLQGSLTDPFGHIWLIGKFLD
jgi:PhnB protein